MRGMTFETTKRVYSQIPKHGAITMRFITFEVETLYGRNKYATDVQKIQYISF